jgi:hypothetical protein
MWSIDSFFPQNNKISHISLYAKGRLLLVCFSAILTIERLQLSFPDESKRHLVTALHSLLEGLHTEFPCGKKQPAQLVLLGQRKTITYLTHFIPL